MEKEINKRKYSITIPLIKNTTAIVLCNME